MGRRALGLCVVLLACATLRVEVETDPKTDFAAFRTWQWLPRAGPGGDDPRVESAALEERIRRRIEEGLARRGYRRLDVGADLGVGWHAAVRSRVDVRELNGFYGYGPGWGDRPGSVPDAVVRFVDEGSLVVDGVDLARQRLVWRGTAAAELAPKADPDARARRVDEAVERLLAEFPRRAGE